MFRSCKWAAGIAAVALAAVMMTAAPVLAARGGGGGGGRGGGGGFRGGGGGFRGGSFGGRGFAGRGFEGRGFDRGFGGRGFDRGFGWGYGGWGYGGLGYGGWGYGGYPYYGGYYGGYDYPSYAYSYPYYSDYYPSVAIAPSSVPSTSYYYNPSVNVTAPNQSTAATVDVNVPANAKVWFDDSATTQTGTMRVFASPPLDPSGTYHYNVRVQWNDNGQMKEETRRVEVRPGQTSVVDFTQPAKQ